MKNIHIFFSDAHLGAPKLHDDRRREKRLIQFLENAAEREATIYIVGDLFEFWFEYRQVVPRQNFAVLAALHRIARSGVEIHYLAGNHDLWLGSFLKDELGLIIHHQHLEAAAGPGKIFVTHGDGIAKQDVGYRILKRILRNNANVFLYKLLHPDFGIPFAKLMSHVSREQGQDIPKWQEDYRAYAVERFREGYDAVIMAHTHFPLHEIIEGKHYLNLGDWINHFCYCEINDTSISLRRWPSQEIYRKPVADTVLPASEKPDPTGAIEAGR